MIYKNEALNSFDDLFNFYIQALSKYRDNDIYRGSTSIGPHRDDIDFFINDISLKSFGSQGQQRSSVLSLKLAELEFLKLETVGINFKRLTSESSEGVVGLSYSSKSFKYS